MIIIKYCDCDIADPGCDHAIKYDDGFDGIEVIDNTIDAYWYAKDVVGGIWPEGEGIIKSDPRWAYEYARDIIKGRWLDGEKIVKTSPEYAYLYACDIIKSRWLEAEETIKSGSMSAYLYARDILRDRWPEAEETIKASEYWWARYQNHVDSLIEI